MQKTSLRRDFIIGIQRLNIDRSDATVGVYKIYATNGEHAINAYRYFKINDYMLLREYCTTFSSVCNNVLV